MRGKVARELKKIALYEAYAMNREEDVKWIYRDIKRAYKRDKSK